MKRILMISAAAMILAACSREPVYKDADAPIEKRVEDLLRRMTVKEKIMQLNQYVLGRDTNPNNLGDNGRVFPPTVGSFIFVTDSVSLRNELQRRAVEETRLGIPAVFGHDVIHGFRTIYPIPLAQGCSWDPELVGQLCSVAAAEARKSGVDWTFAPMIDITNDPRWGRVAESYGEDPYLNAVMGASSVRGFQGDSLDCLTSVAACAKHFVGYGRSIGGRDYTAADISMQAMWDTYLIPYEACVDAGVATLMSAFTNINGVPATANRLFLKDILRDRLGFRGFVVSDWDAVEQLISQGFAQDRKDAALKAFAAGVDMDMRDSCYAQHFPALVDDGLLSEKQLDESVRRVLELKFRLGLFENPYTPMVPESERLLSEEAVGLAQKLAEESMVLLKNDGVLPLEGVGKIAVIGPVAKDQINLLGSWRSHGKPSDVRSVFDGMVGEFGLKADIGYARGCDFDGKDRSGFNEALRVARGADVVVLCLGEKAGWSGENASRSTIAIPWIQEELAKCVAGTGKKVVLLLANGRPLELGRIERYADAIVEMWQPGITGGDAVSGILSGRINPSGRLCITFPWSSGQIPISYNEKRSGRPMKGLYQDITSKPLYEFGYGLSYSSFEYGDIKLSGDTVTPGRTLTVSVPVTNVSGVDGQETVLCFISDPCCSVSRPLKELKHFSRMTVPAGQTRTFTFEIDPARDLSFVNANGEPILEDGEFRVIIKDRTASFTLSGAGCQSLSNK